MTAGDAINHKFIDLANHRGLGDRINLDNMRAYNFRRKWEVRRQMIRCSRIFRVNFLRNKVTLVTVRAAGKEISS